MEYETFHRNYLCIFDINVLNFVILNIQSLFSYLVFRFIYRCDRSSQVCPRQYCSESRLKYGRNHDNSIDEIMTMTSLNRFEKPT